MTRPTILTPLPCSLIAATAGAALALSMASGAQADLNDGGPTVGGFATVLNYPGDALPVFGFDDVGDSSGATLTQVNLNAGNAYVLGFDYYFTEFNFYEPTSSGGGTQARRSLALKSICLPAAIWVAAHPTMRTPS